jgi:hypothetical protein
MPAPAKNFVCFGVIATLSLATLNSRDQRRAVVQGFDTRVGGVFRAQGMERSDRIDSQQAGARHARSDVLPCVPGGT